MNNLELERIGANYKYRNLIGMIPVKVINEEKKFFKTNSKRNLRDTHKVRKIWELTDRINSYISKELICKPGCSGCCHNDVSLTEVEAKIISEYTGKKINHSEALRTTSHHGEPCTFLINDSCSIYEVRPYVCRSHISLMDSAYWCQPSRSLNVKVPMFKPSEIARLYLSMVNNHTVKDIRDWFEV